MPLAGDPAQTYENYSWTGIGRLKPGVTVADADKDLRRAHQPIWDTKDKDRNVSPFVRDMRAELTRDFDAIALALGAAVGILLLVACANVASVMLARALNRRREMGIRLAIGASRTRLLRQLFVENILLAVAGGALGLLLGSWALDTLVRAAADQVPRWAAFDLDWRVMAFSVGLAAITVILFGWAPAFHALRGDLRAARCRPRLPGRRPRRRAGGRWDCWSPPSSRWPRCCWCAVGCSIEPTIASATSTRASSPSTC